VRTPELAEAPKPDRKKRYDVNQKKDGSERAIAPGDELNQTESLRQQHAAAQRQERYSRAGAVSQWSLMGADISSSFQNL